MPAAALAPPVPKNANKIQSSIFEPISAAPIANSGAKRVVPGSHAVNTRIARPQTTGTFRQGLQTFDPINATVQQVRNAPSLPPVVDSLNPFRRMDSRQKDTETMEFSHRTELNRNPRAFFRQPGELQTYANAATAQSDMLVWQSSQRRDEATTSLLNRLPTRPYSESYDYPSWALANTYLTAQSPFLQHRHAQAQRRRLQFEVDDPLCGTLQRPQTTGPLREAVTSAQQSAAATAAAKAMNWQSSMSRPFTTTQSGGGAAGARTAMAGTTPAPGAASESRVSSTPTLPARVRAKLNRAKTAAAVTHDKLLDFERKQHQKMNFQDWTKEELIELIQAEGLEVPGPNEWDQDAGVYRKRVEPKQVYVDFCKRQLFEAEPKPLVRMGKCLKGRDCYCLVDIFKAANGAVRVQAYDDQDSREYQMLLIPSTMHELDLELPPTFSDDNNQWLGWAKLVVPRLELTSDGLLQVGEPPLQANGLPAHFTLGESSKPELTPEGTSSSSSTQSKAKTSGQGNASKSSALPPPGRMHVTLFFRSL